MENNKFDVFICYSRRDTEIADKIFNYFADNEISCFIDREVIGVGEQWQIVISKGIRSSEIVMVLFTDNLNKKPEQCLKEINVAKKNKKKIAPIRFTEAEYAPGVDIELGPLNYFDATNRTIDEALPEICLHIKRLLGRSNERIIKKPAIESSNVRSSIETSDNKQHDSVIENYQKEPNNLNNKLGEKHPKTLMASNRLSRSQKFNKLRESLGLTHEAPDWENEESDEVSGHDNEETLDEKFIKNWLKDI